MTAKEKQIIQTITDVLPNLSNEDKAFLLGFGEGLAASVQPKPRTKKSKPNDLPDKGGEHIGAFANLS